eukprot:gnl/TRDRNA2_/TRDRNA2_75749_c0_seq2.p1 gnl/TRDRNA2_/TRDRNA2_75749_c0~~gnl/TRDRNA2_/TRDRNA2_75749_c0_seq2.p1  ORF type:complete len:170 (+),score=16.81 gnl/TRDRNA2_/TRDRNA2_75749_c0_seq2:75-584(+)
MFRALEAAIDKGEVPVVRPSYAPVQARPSSAPHLERGSDDEWRNDAATTVASVQGAVVANEEGEDNNAKRLRKGKGRGKGRRKAEQPAEDLPFIGCNVRMLKGAKMWSVGDIFRITGSCASGSCWRIDGGLLLSKDLEGIQWEWETSPVEAEEGADRFAAELCEASPPR